MSSSDTELYEPRTPLSVNLMESIILKFSAQTDLIGKVIAEEPYDIPGYFTYTNPGSHGQIGRLSWNIPTECDQGTILIDIGPDLFQISWTSDGIKASDKRVERLEDNMQFFSELENAIYSEFDKLRQAVREKLET